MPKRIVDGEGLWRSDKLAEINPAWIKSEYANLLPLALANGSFEANPRRIWSTVYSYNRPEITVEQVEQILDELERVKLLFRWTDESTGKTGGYFVGIEKPGRLPSASRLQNNHELLGPKLPKEMLQKFLSQPETTGQPLASQPVANGPLGFGLGLGLGSGMGAGQPLASQEADQSRTLERTDEFNSTEIARALCSENGWSGEKIIWALKDAIDFQATQVPESSLEQVGEWLVQSYRAHRSAKGSYAVGVQKFFCEGLYQSSELSSSAKMNILTDNPATRARAQMEGD